MTDKKLPSPELLRKLLRYEPDTGKLFWRKRGRDMFVSDGDCQAWNTKYADHEAFKTNTHTYKGGSIFDKRYPAHRVIWAMQTGEWPKNQIDHVDRNRGNNKWDNLREATRSQNNANRPSHFGSSSEYLGVCWYLRDRKWEASIHKNGARMHLGRFACEITAALAYDEAAKRLHGEFANLNFPDATKAV